MGTFPALSEEFRIQRLAPPAGEAPVSMVLDTDTYNEIDDQYAVVYSLFSEDRLRVEALYAAPFYNSRSAGPGDGMEKSYEEILRLLDRMGRTADGFVFRGSTSYLPDASTPVESAAAADLMQRARASREGPLYVVAIGAITNVASALLMAPDIIEKIVVVWLGGNPHYWPTTAEFNLQQDVPAASVILDSGVPFVHVPCRNVAEHVRTTLPEVERWVKGRGAIGDYLYEIFRDYHADPFAWSKVIWDITPVGWLIDPAWVPSTLIHAPVLNPNRTWSLDWNRHLMRTATAANRDAIFGDLFRKLERRA